MTAETELLVRLRQSIAEAGLPIADEASANPRGGIHLTPIATPPGIRVSWSVHTASPATSDAAARSSTSSTS
jgi:hypothetical protein